PHVVGHVGDVDLKQVVSVGQALHVDRVVKIFGGLAVDGHDGERAKVAPAFSVKLGSKLRRGLRLGQHLGWEAVRQVELADDDLDVHAEFFAASQNFDHAA